MNCVEEVMERVFGGQSADGCEQNAVIRFCHTFGGVTN